MENRRNDVVLPAVSAPYARVKKVLALVMAFAMAFTMMATAGAAYTDQADIEATEAVDMLTTLGIMSGDPDGSFRPNDTITRAEACRMIYSIRTNSDDASAYANMQTTFTDVSSDAWYAGYVKHCQSVGIVSGRSETTFDPNSDVTGVELALMCLRVMGYDPATANIGGSTWSTTTIGLATEAGLLQDVTTAITSACPRQWAAQIMYNMLQAPTVQWSTDTNSYTKYFDNGEERDSVGMEYLDLWVNVGTLTTIDGDNLNISMTASDEADSDNTRDSFTSLDADYSSLLGQHVKVLFRDNKANDVIGVYPTDDNTTYTVNMKDIEKDGARVKFDGTSYSFDDSTLRVEILEPDGDISTENVTSDYFDVDATLDGSVNALKTQSVTFVDNDGDGRLNIAFITKYDNAEVTYVGADRITAGSTYRMEDENISEDLAQDDFAMISWNRYDECRDINPAEILVDTLNSRRSQDGYTQYRIGDVWYNVSDSMAENVTVNDTVKAYVVAGVIVDIDTDDGTGAIPTNIAVVVGAPTAGSTTSTLYGDQAKMRFFDGTLKTVTLSDNSIAGTALQLGRAYRVSGSDSNMRLQELESTTENSTTVGRKYNGYQTLLWGDYTANDELDAALNSSYNTIAGQRVADDAVIILHDENGGSKLITGKQFNNLATNTAIVTTDGVGAAFTKEVSGLDRIRLASVEVAAGSVVGDISGTSNDNYGYITADADYMGDYIEYTIWNGSENLTVREENTDETDRTKGTIIGYSSIDSDGYIQDVDGDIGTIQTSSNGDLTIAANRSDATDFIAVGGNQLDVTADTKVLFVDSDADGEDIGQPFTYGTTAMRQAINLGDRYADNVAYIVDSSDNDELELLVMDSTGAFFFDRPDSDNNQGGSTGGDDSTSTEDGQFTYTTESASSLTASGASFAMVNNTREVRFSVTAGTGVTVASFDWEVLANGRVVARGNQTNMVSGLITTSGAGVDADAEVEIRLTNIVVTSIGAGASADAINNALKQENAKVTITGDVTGTISVPETATLVIKDDVRLQSGVTINAEPGATVMEGSKTIVGTDGLQSDEPIGLAIQESTFQNVSGESRYKNYITYTLNANATLAGTLELARKDKLVGNYTVTGTGGAQIIVYNNWAGNDGKGTGEWQVSVGISVDDATLESIHRAAAATGDGAGTNRTYSWNTGGYWTASDAQ